MRGGVPTNLLWISPRREVMPMDIENVLTLMIAFGMLVAFIMSDKNRKK